MAGMTEPSTDKAQLLQCGLCQEKFDKIDNFFHHFDKHKDDLISPLFDFHLCQSGDSDYIDESSGRTRMAMNDILQTLGSVLNTSPDNTQSLKLTSEAQSIDNMNRTALEDLECLKPGQEINEEVNTAFSEFTFDLNNSKHSKLKRDLVSSPDALDTFVKSQLINSDIIKSSSDDTEECELDQDLNVTKDELITDIITSSEILKFNSSSLGFDQDAQSKNDGLYNGVEDNSDVLKLQADSHCGGLELIDISKDKSDTRECLDLSQSFEVPHVKEQNNDAKNQKYEYLPDLTNKGRTLNRTFRCGACRQDFPTICCLHTHMENSVDSQSYYYDKATRTCIPKDLNCCFASKSALSFEIRFYKRNRDYEADVELNVDAESHQTDTAQGDKGLYDSVSTLGGDTRVGSPKSERESSKSHERKSNRTAHDRTSESVRNQTDTAQGDKGLYDSVSTLGGDTRVGSPKSERESSISHERKSNRTVHDRTSASHESKSDKTAYDGSSKSHESKRDRKAHNRTSKHEIKSERTAHNSSVDQINGINSEDKTETENTKLIHKKETTQSINQSNLENTFNKAEVLKPAKKRGRPSMNKIKHSKPESAQEGLQKKRRRGRPRKSQPEAISEVDGAGKFAFIDAVQIQNIKTEDNAEIKTVKEEDIDTGSNNYFGDITRVVESNAGDVEERILECKNEGVTSQAVDEFMRNNSTKKGKGRPKKPDHELKEPRRIRKKSNFLKRTQVQKTQWTKENKNERIPCSNCDKLILRYCMKNHLLSCTMDRSFSCGMCTALFATKGGLVSHMKCVHLKENPYQCEYCGERFFVPSKLAKHKRDHTGERNFVCSVCDKRFKHEEYLRKHEKLHTGIKDQICATCGKMFYTNWNLRQHELTHREVAAFACTMCHKSFTTKRGLKKHLKTSCLRTKITRINTDIDYNLTGISGVQCVETSVYGDCDKKSMDVSKCLENNMDVSEDAENKMDAYEGSESSMNLPS